MSVVYDVSGRGLCLSSYVSCVQVGGEVPRRNLVRLTLL